MTKRMVLGAVLVVAGTAGMVWAGLADVVLNDGQVLFGEVTDTASGHRITMPGGGTTDIARSMVKEVRRYESPDDAYAKKSAALPKDDAKGHLELALWAHDQGMMDRMAEQARAVLATIPEHSAARLLMMIHEQSKLGPVTGGGDDRDGNGGGDGGGPTSQPELPTLTDRDINVIRVVELKPGEPLPMSFREGALEQAWTQLAALDPNRFGPREKNEFLRAPPNKQLELILSMTAVDLIAGIANMVTVNRDPTPLRVWKTRVQPWVLKNCATAECHGGPTGGTPWRLISARMTDDKTTYTNFYIMSQYQGPRGGRLIDRDLPQDSLLLQYALPKERSPRTHPLVKGNPIPVCLPSTEDAMYRGILAWIRDREIGGLRIRAVYNINYPPGSTSGPGSPGPGPGAGMDNRGLLNPGVTPDGPRPVQPWTRPDRAGR